VLEGACWHAAQRIVYTKVERGAPCGARGTAPPTGRFASPGAWVSRMLICDMVCVGTELGGRVERSQRAR